ncbi:MAG: radical SAM protein [Anaerolineales bacterium]|nr:radical SAM protein [Anaerolineales bacterium]
MSAKPNFLQRLLNVRRSEAPTLAPGMYHFRREARGRHARFHLRVERDGSGLLLANASVAARMTQSGVLIASGLLRGEPDAVVLARMQDVYGGVDAGTLERDIARVRDLIARLLDPEEAASFNLDDVAATPNPADLIAPLTADLPIGSPDQIRPLVEKLWAVGIPHVVFTVEAEMRADHVVRAVERASDIGLITGVRGRGLDLGAGTLLNDLANVGVDHVSVYYASHRREIHDALYGAGDHAAAEDLIRRVRAREITPVGEVVLTDATLRELEETVAVLNAQAVRNAGFWALAEPTETTAPALGANALPQAAARVEAASHQQNVQYVWYPTVRVAVGDASIVQAAARRGPRCSGDLALRVELDGRVIAPRGGQGVAGNLLTDPWDAIWAGPALVGYRARLQTPTHCDTCPGLALCAADCPKDPNGWADA